MDVAVTAVLAYYANDSAMVDLMATRNVVLTDHQEQFVDELVSSGRYQNASEVLREGLRLMQHREAEDKDRLKVLREAARLGISDIEAGCFREFGSATKLRSHLDSLTKKTMAENRKR